MNDYLHPALSVAEALELSSLALAYVGDGVYELMVRTGLAGSGHLTNSDLHRVAVDYVSAKSQARAVEKILPFLNEQERSVYRRGRNAHVNSVPKNTDISVYHAATGFESLFGFLYLIGERSRLNELFELIMKD